MVGYWIAGKYHVEVNFDYEETIYKCRPVKRFARMSRAQ